MLKRFLTFAGCLTVVSLCCLAVFAQASPANTAGSAGKAAVPIFDLKGRDALRSQILEARRRQQDPCFCNHASGCGASDFLAARRYFSPAIPPIEVREIDFDGLKKILQRDPKDTRPLLINFWATWCDGCREEFPDLVKIDNDYRDRLNFISVSLDDVAEIKTTVPEFLAKMKAQMSVVLLNVKDPEPAIHAVDATWDGALPATYLYDKDGKVVFKYFGAIKPADLRKAIDQQLGSKP
jgi:thiol-disulfide isomerase/thioredoxin